MVRSSVLNENFWLNKKVFLTGHTGFKGSWLSIWLKMLGVELAGFSLKEHTNPSLFHEAKVGDNMLSLYGDIRDFSALDRAITAFKPDIIIHMAAQPLVRQSYLEPVKTFETNVMGTVNLFEVARKVESVKAILNITTDKCYENNEWQWGYREYEPLGGHDPYSSSKACSELVTNAYRQSFLQKNDVFIASARAGNVIGGGDWSNDRLIPDIISAFENKKPVSIRFPGAIRPWQHVLEPLSGYLKLIEKLYNEGSNFAEAWNFGPFDNDAKPVIEIDESLGRLWDGEPEWKVVNNNEPHEAKNLKLDISKAITKLQWQPKWSLEYSLKKIVNWHSNWTSGIPASKICTDEINEYRYT